MYSKNHREVGKTLVAACDDNLLGKTLRPGFFLSEGFYGREKISEEELSSRLKDCHIANLVGEKSVRVARKMGLVARKGVLKVGKVPHVQILVMK